MPVFSDVRFVGHTYTEDGGEVLSTNNIIDKIANNFTEEQKAQLLVTLFMSILSQEKVNNIKTLLKLNGDNYKKVAQDLFKKL